MRVLILVKGDDRVEVPYSYIEQNDDWRRMVERMRANGYHEPEVKPAVQRASKRSKSAPDADTVEETANEPRGDE